MQAMIRNTDTYVSSYLHFRPDITTRRTHHASTRSSPPHDSIHFRSPVRTVVLHRDIRALIVPINPIFSLPNVRLFGILVFHELLRSLRWIADKNVCNGADKRKVGTFMASASFE